MPNAPVPALRSSLEIFLGRKLQSAEAAKLEKLALEEWERDGNTSYELLLDRFRRMRAAGLIGGVPSENALRSDFGLPTNIAARLRRELLNDRKERRAQLGEALSSDEIADHGDEDVPYMLCPVPDYLSPDFLTLGDEIEADYRAAKKKAPPAPARTRGRRAGYHYYEVDPKLLAEMKRRLQ